MERWQPAYIGLGSNLSDPEHQVLVAAGRLAQLPRTCCVRVSPVYVSRPLGPVAQPDFVNAAAGLLTQLSARELLDELRAMEAAFGRPEQRERWGPRILDLDLLVIRARALGRADTHPAASWDSGAQLRSVSSG